jgi:hypothetical protein
VQPEEKLLRAIGRNLSRSHRHRGRSNSSANALRSEAGRSVIASKLGTGLCQSLRSTWSVLYADWPERSKYADSFFRASEMDMSSRFVRDVVGVTSRPASE